MENEVLSQLDPEKLINNKRKKKSSAYFADFKCTESVMFMKISLKVKLITFQLSSWYS